MTLKTNDVNKNSYTPKFGLLVCKYLICCVNDFTCPRRDRHTVIWTHSTGLLVKNWFCLDQPIGLPTHNIHVSPLKPGMSFHMCPYAFLHLPLCFVACVLMHDFMSPYLFIMCPYARMHVPLWINVCVLICFIMCPYALMLHVSLSVSLCVLMHKCMCPYA